MTIIFLETPVHKRPAILNFSGSLDWVQKLFEEYLERRKLKAILASLSNNELRNIGLTDAEVLSLENLPLQESSVDYIAKAQKTQNGKW